MKEQGLIRKRIQIRDIRNPYFCVWLQEMAEQGLFFKRRDLLTAQFMKAMPEKRRYRTVEKAYHSFTDEEMDLYESSGWEPISYWGGTTFFTSTREDAPEIFSDQDSYIDAFRKKRKWSVLWIIVLALFVINYIRTEVGSYFDKEIIEEFGRLHTISNYVSSFGMNILLTLCMLAVCCVWFGVIIDEVRMIRLYSGVDSANYDVPFDNKSYLRCKKQSKITDAILICMLAILPFIWVNIFIDEIPSGSKALKYSKSHPVMLKDIDAKEWEEALPLIEKPEDGNGLRVVDYLAGTEHQGFHFKKSYREQLFIEKYESAESEEAKNEFGYCSEYMVAREEKTATEYLGEEISFDKYEKCGEGAWKRALDEAEFECAGVDYAGYLVTEDSYNANGLKTQHLYLRKGTDIQIVSYIGGTNLKDKLDLFIKEFDE